MSREIRFRAFDDLMPYMSKPFTLYDIQNGKIQFTKDVKIMQFTGLHDKNGREIYEGDILNIGNSIFGFIERSKGIKHPYEVKREGCDFVLKRPDLPFTWGRLSRLSDLNWECEIIGNIHENPELLTQ